MQDDSNGESSFEFVSNRKPEDATGEGNSVTISGPGTQQKGKNAVSSLLSMVPPPSNLPNLVMAQAPLKTDMTEQLPMEQASDKDNKQRLAAVINQPELPRPPPTFSAAIPQNEDVINKILSSTENKSPPGGILGWVKGAVASGGILSRVAEKAKSSVGSVITTLDPQMKEFIYSGGDTDIVVASDKELEVSPIREAFQQVFGKATVYGHDAPSVMVAAQPVGFAASRRAAEERVKSMRQNKSLGEVPIVAVENFLLQVLDEKWFELTMLVLEDPTHGIVLEVYTQPTPVPSLIVEHEQKEGSTTDYSLRWSGLAVPIGKLMADHLQVSPDEWHESFTGGVSRREMLLLAARSLAGMYKSALGDAVL